jgi:hypothetical protein
MQPESLPESRPTAHVVQWDGRSFVIYCAPGSDVPRAEVFDDLPTALAWALSENLVLLAVL